MKRMVRRTLICVVCACLNASGATVLEVPGVPAAVAAAIADPSRPREQIELDRARRPAGVLAFAGVKPGDRIADFMPGNAYFTRLFSGIVGSTGRVYAFIPTEQIAGCPASETAGGRALAHDPRYANVTLLVDRVGNYHVPEPLDVLWTAQNYHDLHDSFMGPADIESLNRSFFNSLKPGGIFLVIDHVAEPGSELRDTETLHRIDPVRMRREIEAAGFLFEAQSEVLRNPGDDHTLSIFDPRVRGRTDQIVLRFRRPL